MVLPPRVYFTLIEAAMRWNCSTADIAAWAAAGRFNIVTAIAPVSHGLHTIAGFVIISVTDILQMFRRTGASAPSGIVRRVRPKDREDWVVLADPAEQIVVTVDDLYIMAEEVQRFELDWDLLHRPTAHVGSTARYDWDGMYTALMVRVHDRGLPATQAELVAEAQDWFIAQSATGEAPDERTIRRRLTPVWRALRGDRDG